MKTVIKLIAVVLLLTLILTACGSTEEELFDTPFPENEVSYDFRGKDFIIVGYERYGRIELDPYQESENNFWSEKLMYRYREIESKFNVNVKIKKDDGQLKAQFMAGIHWGDVYDSFLSTLNPILNAGLCLSLNQIDGFSETIDSGKWGSVNSLETFKRGEDYYGFRAGYWGIPFPAFSGIIYSNAKLMRDYDIPVLEMVENGEWTWKNFEDACLKIGGTYENADEPLGYVFDNSWGDYFMRAAIASNGGRFAVVNSEGRYVDNMQSKEVVEALNWVVSFKQAINSEVISGGPFIEESSDRLFPRFQDNLLGFLCQYSYVGTSDSNGFMYNDIDFNILPFPCGPRGIYGEWGSYISFADRYNVVPVACDLDMVNSIYAPLFEPFEGETKTSWKEKYTSVMFINEASAKYYFEMYDTAIYDFNEMTSTFNWYGVLSGGSTVTKALEASANARQSSLDKTYNKYFD